MQPLSIRKKRVMGRKPALRIYRLVYHMRCRKCSLVCRQDFFSLSPVVFSYLYMLFCYKKEQPLDQAGRVNKAEANGNADFTRGGGLGADEVARRRVDRHVASTADIDAEHANLRRSVHLHGHGVLTQQRCTDCRWFNQPHENVSPAIFVGHFSQRLGSVCAVEVVAAALALGLENKVLIRKSRGKKAGKNEGLLDGGRGR